MNYKDYIKEKNEILELKGFLKSILETEDKIKEAFDLVTIYNEPKNLKQFQVDFFKEINDKFTDLETIINNKYEGLLGKVYLSTEEDFCLYNKRFLLKKIEDKIVSFVDGSYVEYDILKDNIYIIKKLKHDKGFIDIQKDYIIIKNSLFFFEDKEINEIILPNNKNEKIEVKLGDFINLKKADNEEFIIEIKNSIISPVTYKNNELINPKCESYLSSLAKRHKIDNLVTSFKTIESKKYETYEELYNAIDEIYQLLIIMNDKTGRKELHKPEKIEEMINNVFDRIKDNFSFVLNSEEIKPKLTALSVLSDMKIIGQNFYNNNNAKGILTNENILKHCLLSENIVKFINQKIKSNEYKI